MASILMAEIMADVDGTPVATEHLILTLKNNIRDSRHGGQVILYQPSAARILALLEKLEKIEKVVAS